MIHPWLSKERELTQVQRPHTNVGQDGWNSGTLEWLGTPAASWKYVPDMEILVKIFTFLSYNMLLTFFLN